MLPLTCGVTVTDSKAAFLPISSRYRGTSCATAGTAVTRGRGIAGAAWTLPLLQAIVASSTVTARASFALRKETLVLSIVIAILFPKYCRVYAEAARPDGRADSESSCRAF